MFDDPFMPAGALGVTPAASTSVAVTTGVQQLSLPASTGKSMRLINSGTSLIAWSYGVSANLSMTNGVVMLPNTVEIFSVPQAVTVLSVIGAAAGSTLIAHEGEGV